MSLDALANKVKAKLAKTNDDIVLDLNRKHVCISTGSILLDNILGGGLLVQKRVTEVFGLESSGKTTICLQSCANAVKQQIPVIFLDFEQTFDVNYGKALGADITSPFLKVFQPRSLEEGLTILREAEKLPDLHGCVIIIDSIAAAKPQELLDKAGEQQRIGLHAQRIGEFILYIQNAWCGTRDAYVLCTNQVRRVPGQGSLYQSKAFKDAGVGFGNSDSSFTTTGGTQVRFVCSIRLSLDFAGKIEEGSFEAGDKHRVGNFIKAHVVKNKIHPPFQTAKLAIVYGKGTDDSFAMFETLSQHGYIVSAGGSFTYYDSNKNEVGQGLSFKIRGKTAFMEALSADNYKEDMKKSFEALMRGVEAVEIASEDTNDESTTTELADYDFETITE